MSIGAAVLIHGLPDVDTGIDPLLQVEQIKSQLQAIVPIVWPFDWGKEYGFRRSYRLLRRGAFGKELAEKFDGWLRNKTQSWGGEQKIMVVAYSIGGLIFYSWAVDARTDSKKSRERITLAVTVASPYQCSTHSVDIEGPDGNPYTLDEINEPRVDPATVLGNLAAGRLKILLAQKDRTILPYDSSFVQVLGSDPPAAELQHLQEETIEGASHRDICTRDKTREYLQTFCQNLAE